MIKNTVQKSAAGKSMAAPAVFFAAFFAIMLLAGGTTSTFAQTCSVLDNFNRPDGALGANWSVVTAPVSLAGNRATGSANSRAIYNGIAAGDGAQACADVFAGTAAAIKYSGIYLKWNGAFDNFFVKLQSNSSSGVNYDTIFFYQDSNAGYASCFSQPLTTPVSAARISVSFNGSALIASLDTDFNGTPDQVYQCAGAPAKTGRRVGMGFFNNAPGASTLDNFGVASPTAAEAALTGRVLDAGGKPVRNALVTLTDQNGFSTPARSNSFGYFRFEGVRAGQTAVISVAAKSLQFTPVVVNVVDGVQDIAIYADAP